MVAGAAGFADTVRLDAAAWDRTGVLPATVVTDAGAAGLLARDLPRRYGGADASPAAIGEATARIGAVCSSLRALLTVQGMVSAALGRWGSAEQRERWLPALATGAAVAGFAATEESAGTELAAVATSIEPSGDALRITGRKRWVTFGATADLLLVIGRLDGAPAAVLVEGDRPGLRREPVRGQLGLRAAQVAHLDLDGVRVPRSHLVAPAGFGLSHVAGTALDHGRYTVAWGCVGLARACQRAATAHAVERVQGAVRLADHQLVRATLGRGHVAVTAAEQLCRHAAQVRAVRDPDAVAATVLAKYAASRAATRVSRDAVQVHGAAGCDPDSLVGRFLRDATVMRIIEGSDEVSELHLADHAIRAHRRSGAAAPARPGPVAVPS
ncbi:acyl-CoA dehydrogenase family protein [Micromonospora endolithica]|uniref:Acyl-CoA dehydrogenase family protein n=1 Tax=Micromonospora endolithica TaxID=230091 RepID=A0A3A9ZB60_9ACTN|nr:acyl-CoA dehydrogenase family protein [Micromonospora endolithica]